MESQPQNPEFRINPENFHQKPYMAKIGKGFFTYDKCSKISNTIFFLFSTKMLVIKEGLDGGSGIHYSLKFSPLFISLKFWVIHENKTNYSLKVKEVAKKSDCSLFIIFFFNSLKK